MKVPKIQEYFPRTESILRKQAEQMKKWGFHSYFKGSSIDNRRVRNYAQIRHATGILTFSRESFDRHFKALQNAFKKGIPSDELRGDFFTHHKDIITSNGKLFTGKALFFDEFNQITRIDKIKDGKSVSSLFLRAGLIPCQYTRVKPIDNARFNIENATFNTNKYYIQRFANC